MNMNLANQMSIKNSDNVNPCLNFKLQSLYVIEMSGYRSDF